MQTVLFENNESALQIDANRVLYKGRYCLIYQNAEGRSYIEDNDLSVFIIGCYITCGDERIKVYHTSDADRKQVFKFVNAGLKRGIRDLYILAYGCHRGVLFTELKGGFSLSALEATIIAATLEEFKTCIDQQGA